jgi:hypothetical protein
MSAMRLVAIVLLVLGVLAIIGGVVYLVVPAHSLPAFVPGHIAGSTAKHSRRGVAGVILGVVLLVAGGIAAAAGGRKPAGR